MLVQRGPLLLVAASSGGEPASALRRRLDLLHSQITLIVTNAIDKLFARNPRYDGRSLLGAPLWSCGPENLACTNKANQLAGLHQASQLHDCCCTTFSQGSQEMQVFPGSIAACTCATHPTFMELVI